HGPAATGFRVRECSPVRHVSTGNVLETRHRTRSVYWSAFWYYRRCLDARADNGRAQRRLAGEPARFPFHYGSELLDRHLCLDHVLSSHDPGEPGDTAAAHRGTDGLSLRADPRAQGPRQEVVSAARSACRDRGRRADCSESLVPVIPCWICA